MRDQELKGYLKKERNLKFLKRLQTKLPAMSVSVLQVFLKAMLSLKQLKKRLPIWSMLLLQVILGMKLRKK